MRAEQVIATHGNTDFDAFGAMLAARLLYPDAVVAVAALNRNVRDFYRLHADELGAVSEVSRLEPDAIRRLIVVEVVERVAARRARGRRARSGVWRRCSSTTTARTVSRSGCRRRPPSCRPTVRSRRLSSGSLPSVSSLRHRSRQPRSRSGIHEDTGSLTYATTTQRDVDALSWCLRHGARQDLVNEYLHAPLAARERELLKHLMEHLEPVESGGEEVLLAAVRWPEYVDGVSNLAHKIVDLTDARALVLLVEMDERVFVVVRSRSAAIDAAAVAEAFGGGGHAQAASAISRLDVTAAREQALDCAPADDDSNASRARRDVFTRRARSARTRACGTR